MKFNPIQLLTKTRNLNQAVFQGQILFQGGLVSSQYWRQREKNGLPARHCQESTPRPSSVVGVRVRCEDPEYGES